MKRRKIPITSLVVVTTGAEKLSGSSPFLKVITATISPTAMTAKIVVMPESKIIVQRVPKGSVLNPNNMDTEYDSTVKNVKPIDEDSKRPRTDPLRLSDLRMLFCVLPVYSSVVIREARTAAISPL